MKNIEKHCGWSTHNQFNTWKCNLISYFICTHRSQRAFVKYSVSFETLHKVENNSSVSFGTERLQFFFLSTFSFTPSICKLIYFILKLKKRIYFVSISVAHLGNCVLTTPSFTFSHHIHIIKECNHKYFGSVLCFTVFSELWFWTVFAAITWRNWTLSTGKRIYNERKIEEIPIVNRIFSPFFYRV